MTYDEEHIEKRSRAIAYAIDARRQKYPGEEPFAYAPFYGHNTMLEGCAFLYFGSAAGVTLTSSSSPTEPQATVLRLPRNKPSPDQHHA